MNKQKEIEYANKTWLAKVAVMYSADSFAIT